MWSKTVTGLFLGLFISMSYVLNINLLLPVDEDVQLITGLILAFPIWAGVITWTYSFERTRTALKVLSLVLLPSAMLNTVLMVA
ncbi:hypothetical protein CS022_00965 [Veronia nyctiphanis]|uniref:Uncharacterized protein n=1 Tax=Veronia nyctiphanis TaxID=1278244 RepID=A0A4Q0YVD0_9GAMM|nr:hypothetical protein [Veronia nyctiphanis]RXJ74823.1 hypothetical protein CS022_00965 [Veronia nyctiphanis]